MKKHVFTLLVLLLALAGNAFGQRTLEIKDVTTSLNVFSGKDTEAGIVISCPCIEMVIIALHLAILRMMQDGDQSNPLQTHIRYRFLVSLNDCLHTHCFLIIAGIRIDQKRSKIKKADNRIIRAVAYDGVVVCSSIN